MCLASAVERTWECRRWSEGLDDLTRSYLRGDGMNAGAETLGGARRHACCTASRVSIRAEGSDESRGVCVLGGVVTR